MKKPTAKLLKELSTKGGTHKIGELTITFHYKRNPKRMNSFWFHNSDIVTVEYKGRVVTAVCNGELSVTFKENDDTNYKGHYAVEEAIERDYTDKDINKISEHDGFNDNNWIEICYSLNATSKIKKEILGRVDFWRDKMDKYVLANKMTLNQFRKEFYAYLYLSDFTLDDYDEAIDNVVDLIMDEDFWKKETDELMNEMCKNL